MAATIFLTLGALLFLAGATGILIKSDGDLSHLSPAGARSPNVLVPDIEPFTIAVIAAAVLLITIPFRIRAAARAKRRMRELPNDAP